MLRRYLSVIIMMAAVYIIISLKYGDTFLPNTIICGVSVSGLTIEEVMTYPNFISLANQLYLQLVPIENDECGMSAERLESACALQKIKGIYMMPSGGHPTNTEFSDARKKEIAEVIRKRNLQAPEYCIYVSGLSKPLCPGLRIAYLCLPKRYVNSMEQGMFSQNLKISSLNMEIAAEVIRSGTALKIIQKKRKAAMERNRMFLAYFPDSHPRIESFYQWLELPAHLSGRLCEAELASQGVSVFGAERFSVGNQLSANYVRVVTSSAENEEQLGQGLTALQNFIKGQNKMPLFIV